MPPYNGVVGAVGAALLALEKAQTLQAGTRFRGWDMGQVDYTIREFTCQGCENRCDMKEFRVEGEKTYWGDQCGDRYRRRAKVEFRPVVEDLIRLRKDWLLEEYDPTFRGRTTVAFPRALYFHDRFPYWNAFFRGIGFAVRVTPETNRAIVHEGLETTIAEPCFPIQVAHGQLVEALAIAEADFVFLPNYVKYGRNERGDPELLLSVGDNPCVGRSTWASRTLTWRITMGRRPVPPKKISARFSSRICDPTGMN